MNIYEIGDRLIAHQKGYLDIIPTSLPKLREKGDINGVLMNFRLWAEAHILPGIIQWRRGQDPRREFAAGLDAIEQGIAEAAALRAGPQDIDELKLWIAHPIAFLMNRTLPALEGSDKQLVDFPLISASFLLADALYDRAYKHRLPGMIRVLGTKKRQMLALVSFQAYFDLLDAAGDRVRIAELAAHGDALYLRRAKDVDYDDAFLGGGPDNPIVLDWQLAAVLKKVGFEGDSPNRWRWD